MRKARSSEQGHDSPELTARSRLFPTAYVFRSSGGFSAAYNTASGWGCLVFKRRECARTCEVCPMQRMDVSFSEQCLMVREGPANRWSVHRSLPLRALHRLSKALPSCYSIRSGECFIRLAAQ